MERPKYAHAVVPYTVSTAAGGRIMTQVPNYVALGGDTRAPQWETIAISCDTYEFQ